MATPLVSLAEYKSMAGIKATDVSRDDQITSLLAAASKSVRNYTARSFVLATGTPTSRSFPYDDSGIVDVDDFVSLTSVSTNWGVPGGSYTFAASEYTAMPQDTDETTPYYWIVMHSMVYGMSPEMGFTYNLDNYVYTGADPLITITADWGWPSIPEDVKLATVWTIQGITDNPQGPVSEAIEGYARSWGTTGGGYPTMAVPNRARDILSPYQRVFV